MTAPGRTAWLEEGMDHVRSGGERLCEKITRPILVSEKGDGVFWNMKAGAHTTMPSHPREQIFWVLSGKMEFALTAPSALP